MLMYDTYFKVKSWECFGFVVKFTEYFKPNLLSLFSAACQAPTVDVKMAWLSELRRILTNQQKLLRGLRTIGTITGHTQTHSGF